MCLGVRFIWMVVGEEERRRDDFVGRLAKSKISLDNVTFIG